MPYPRIGEIAGLRAVPGPPSDYLLSHLVARVVYQCGSMIFFSYRDVYTY
jgi:hypothetical protein